MSIPTPFNPLGTLKGVKWYNWTAGRWVSAWSDRTAYSDEYIISDFIPVTPGSCKYAAVGVDVGGSTCVGVMEYNANRSRIDYWSAIPEGVTYVRTVNLSKNAAYVRIQTTRALYRESYVIQNGVYLFKGADNPPKPITQP